MTPPIRSMALLRSGPKVILRNYIQDGEPSHSPLPKFGGIAASHVCEGLFSRPDTKHGIINWTYSHHALLFCSYRFDTPLKKIIKTLARVFLVVVPTPLNKAFQLSRKFLNWIEIRRVRRQIYGRHTCIRAHSLHPLRVMEGCVIHN